MGTIKVTESEARLLTAYRQEMETDSAEGGGWGGDHRAERDCLETQCG